MVEHTKGPWFVSKLERHGELVDCFVSAKDVNGFAYDAEILGDDEYREESGGIERKLADARRIVACVNALEGVPTEWLESYTTGNVENVLQENARLKQERDEAVALVEVMRDALNDARRFIVNGVELGYIKMPDADTPDSAHNTLPHICVALSITPSAALSEIQARTLEEEISDYQKDPDWLQTTSGNVIHRLKLKVSALRKGE